VQCRGGPVPDRAFCRTIAPLMGGDPLPIAISPPGAPLTHFALRHVIREDDTLFLRYERGNNAR